MVALTWPSTFGRGWGAAAVLGGLVGDWAVGAGWCPGLGGWAAVGEAWVGAPDAVIRKKSAKHNVFCRFQWSGLGGGPETLMCKKSAKHTVCVCKFLPIPQLVADFLQIFSAQLDGRRFCRLFAAVPTVSISPFFTGLGCLT